jgi:uncharacterized delta-60 repeat protein
MKCLLIFLSIAFCFGDANAQSLLDPSFGNNGKVSPMYNNSDQGGVVFLAPNSSGYFYAIAAGQIAKFDTHGNIMNSFGANGWATPPFYVYNSYNYYYTPSFLIEQTDGSIIAGGSIYNHILATSSDIFLFKLKVNGQSLDSTFGTNGLVIQNISNQDYAYCMTQQLDGKIIIGGGCASNDTLMLVRFNSDGGLDTGFGTSGVIKKAIGQYNSSAKSIFVLNNGKIVVGVRTENFLNNADFAILRFHPNGLIDTSFGNSGIIFTDAYGSGYGLLADMVIQSDNKILLIGGNPIIRNGFLVIRLHPDGSKDTTFNHSGVQKIDIDNSGAASRIALQTNGDIIIGGYYDTTSEKENWGVIRLTSTGQLDQTFGIGGKIRLSMGDRQERISDMKIQSDGKILSCGYYENGSWPNLVTRMIVVRLLKDGINEVAQVPRTNHVIRIYPNPADGTVNLESEIQIVQVQVADITGRMVFSSEEFPKQEIQTNHIPDGIYILKLFFKDHTTHTEKLSIQHR